MEMLKSDVQYVSVGTTINIEAWSHEPVTACHIPHNHTDYIRVLTAKGNGNIMNAKGKKVRLGFKSGKQGQQRAVRNCLITNMTADSDGGYTVGVKCSDTA